jgi:hypothetical protein
VFAQLPQIRIRFVLATAIGSNLFCSVVSLQTHASIIVTSSNSNAVTVDVTAPPYGDFVHFTAGANNMALSVPATLGPNGIPNIGVTSGDAFQNFSNSYSNGDGEISVSDNPFAVTVIHGSGIPASNKRLWFGGWGTLDAAGFDLELPRANGTLEVYAGGFAGGTSGGGTLSAVSSTGADTASILRSGHGTGFGPWAGVFTVAWMNETPGSLLSVSLQNVPVSASGNTGLIAAAVTIPEPGAVMLAAVAMFGVLLIQRRGGRVPVEQRRPPSSSRQRPFVQAPIPQRPTTARALGLRAAGTAVFIVISTTPWGTANLIRIPWDANS